MPESGEKKELGGLARSIDSLFSRDGGSDAGAAEAADDPGSPAAADAGAATPHETPIAEPTFGEGALAEPAFGDGLLADPVFPGGDPVSDVSSDVGAVAPEPPAEAEPTPLDVGAELSLPDPIPAEPEPSAAETDPIAGEAEPEHVITDVDATVAAIPELEGLAVEPPEATPVADIPPGAGQEDTAAVPPPAEEDAGPLTLAVESFLAGGSDERRVRELAEGHLAAREFDPVARAVVRLAEQAPDADAPATRLAQELSGPLVQSRIVLQMGRERDVARREVYYAACEKLGLPMAEAIRDGMVEAPDRFARRAYFDALVAMGDVSRPVVEAMAESDNRFLVRNAVAILGEVGGDSAVPLVEAALANGDPKVRREALLSLARLHAEDAAALIVGRLVDDTDPTVRAAAVVAAGELRIERALRPLIEMLEEAYEEYEVVPLLHAVGQIGDPGAVPAIEKHAVRDSFGPPRTNVRIAAYQALNHIGTPRARRLLNQAVSDKDGEVRSVVKNLLGMR